MGGPQQRRVRAFVTGRVQGVWFRASTETQARRLGLLGWVRNLSDGRVEFVAEGDADRVDRLLVWARRGPPEARVESLEVTEEEPGGVERSFEVRR